MKILKKALKIIAWTFGSIFLLILIFCIYVWQVSKTPDPKVTQSAAVELKREDIGPNLLAINDNWLRKNKYGLYEMYVSGDPLERGIINGKLSKELLIQQEKAFTDQIKTMIPSSGYLKFLKYVIGFMNRNLSDHVTEEYKEEIYGISLSASDSFRWIGENYSRQLNYHAAHDIGHALQNLMLVGCTSFGAWDNKTEDGALLIGRNFDFWVGDEFAKNKIVEFVRPGSGHNFAFVTWGGFIGVVSGMNTKGLTVTINAAKSSIPTDAATPVSLVAREILQYAGNIQEAVAIAHKRKMFVSESFLISSASDHRSVIIEKTPDTLSVYDPHSDHIVCANHYQSVLFANQELNIEQKKNSASVYRFQRTEELLKENYPLTPQKMANILRDTKGKGGKDIGLGNEKAVNQLIAHHSVIFMPDSLRMWVSTSPWQLGEYVCYDLRKIFAENAQLPQGEISDSLYNISPDPILKSDRFAQYLKFKSLSKVFKAGQGSAAMIPELIATNPEYFETYQIAGDFYAQKKNRTKAIEYYQMALTKEIPRIEERESIKERMGRLKE